MAIGGYAIGGTKGIIYLRAEYPYLVPAIEAARRNLMDRGLLGRDIKGKGFDFDVEVRPGAGAYVCGEETSLIESLEGKRGEPRNKPPYPVNSGYLNKPTIVNNVETFCAVPHIVLNGPEWYADLGVGTAPARSSSASQEMWRDLEFTNFPWAHPSRPPSACRRNGCSGGSGWRSQRQDHPCF